MTGMFEAYPVDESARLHGSGWSPCRAPVPASAFVTRCARCLAVLAADASEHGGRIIFVMASIFEAKRRKGNTPISH
jgi:hypothetical protein